MREGSRGRLCGVPALRRYDAGEAEVQRVGTMPTLRLRKYDPKQRGSRMCARDRHGLLAFGPGDRMGYRPGRVDREGAQRATGEEGR